MFPNVATTNSASNYSFTFRSQQQIPTGYLLDPVTHLFKPEPWAAPCPTCGVGAGQQCLVNSIIEGTLTSRYVFWPHMARVFDAEQLPILKVSDLLTSHA